MKRNFVLLCAALLAIALTVGCTDSTPGPSASPKPTLRPSPSASPAASPSMTAGMSPSVAPSLSPGGANASPSAGGAGGVIEGFKEGDTVDTDKLPENIKKAVEEAYKGAKISGVTYATYMEGQTYLVTLTGASDGTEKVYVKSDGTIVPYAAATP